MSEVIEYFNRFSTYWKTVPITEKIGIAKILMLSTAFAYAMLVASPTSTTPFAYITISIGFVILINIIANAYINFKRQLSSRCRNQTTNTKIAIVFSMLHTFSKMLLAYFITALQVFTGFMIVYLVIKCHIFKTNNLLLPIIHWQIIATVAILLIIIYFVKIHKAEFHNVWKQNPFIVVVFMLLLIVFSVQFVAILQIFCNKYVLYDNIIIKSVLPFVNHNNIFQLVGKQYVSSHLIMVCITLAIAFICGIVTPIEKCISSIPSKKSEKYMTISFITTSCSMIITFTALMVYAPKIISL